MKKNNFFYEAIVLIAIPVALQSLLNSSFTMIDQAMIGQFGSAIVAGVGIASKFILLYTTAISAISVVTGIMLSQYLEKDTTKKVSRSFWVNMIVALAVAIIFLVVCFIFADNIMGLYSDDRVIIYVAAGYLRIVALTFIPVAIETLMITMLRCVGMAVISVITGLFSLVVNTVLNYILIFGVFGLTPMWETGAAIATVISRILSCILTIIFFVIYMKKRNMKIEFLISMDMEDGKQYLKMLIPVLLSEAIWMLGENIYTAIYGNMGYMQCAAMTLTVPIQTLLMGILSGVSQAAGIVVGKSLGAENMDKAYKESKKLIVYGIVGSVILSALLILLGKYYLDIYYVENLVKTMAYQILIAFAVIAPIKVINMILSGGIIRSGGETKYAMIVNTIGIYVFGIPVGLLTAFVFKLDIAWVYFILSLEEVIRMLISFGIFKRKKWMKVLK